MGESAAETVREIEETRDRLDAGFRELERRLPPPINTLKRALGVAVGGGLSGTVFWFVVRRIRGRKEKRSQVRADVPVAVVQVVPEAWAERLTGAVGGRWKPWVLGAGALWLGVRLVEARSLRRVVRAQLAASGASP